ncbi:MAG: chromosome segregation protein SMC [Candidatus Sedimenticola endophacoides]|nr:MAG: chromosome segregation protein SMC [Candidatus Sedimenticola endophacoides]
MRIERIRFRNLNSLAGEWEIDLTHPAYLADGIFAITGPTGAGKSTLLDAVCLALYGRTPRLSRVTKGGNEIMSRHSGDCFAEATFRVGEGRYCSHWSQHRARMRADGELQTPKHELADAETGRVIESGLRGVAVRIETVTGMDFERFTRSMLLAQGGFAAFLQAAPDERAPILEQITGTEIYSRISIRVHERLRAERDRLQALQARMAGIVLLSPEREQADREALAGVREQARGVAERLSRCVREIDWQGGVARLRQELDALAEEALRLREEQAAFQPRRERLQQALRAAELEAPYAGLSAVRRAQADDRTALEAARSELEALRGPLAERGEALRAAQGNGAGARERLEAAAPLLQQVRELDRRLAEHGRAAGEARRRCAGGEARIAEQVHARDAARAAAATARERLARVERRLGEHARDEWLVGALAGVEERCRGLETVEEALRRQGEMRSRAAADLERVEAACGEWQARGDERGRALAAAEEHLEVLRASLERLLDGRLLREHRAEKEGLLRELALVSRIEALEGQRAALREGLPCPLCGATQHPFVRGGTPVRSAAEQRIEALESLIGRGEALEAEIGGQEQALGAAREHLGEARRREAAAQGERVAARKALDGAERALEQVREECALRRRALAAELLPLGIGELPEGGVGALLDLLRGRLRAWQAWVGEQAGEQRRIAECDADVHRLETLIATREGELAEARARLADQERALAALAGERQSLFGERSADAEQRRLDETLSAAEEGERRAREAHDTLQRRHTDVSGRCAALEQGIGRRQPELERLEAAFATALVEAGCAPEARFLEIRLPGAAREALAAGARALDARATGLAARREDRETRLATELAAALSDDSPAQLAARRESLETELDGLRRHVAALEHGLEQNAVASARVGRAREEIAARERECGRWQALHELIGSADGKRYRNFAQGLTFDRMIVHANRQLRKMSDRYLLVHDAARPLELSVIDGYQAGEIRSTRNLSGGESFLVSLALALGLSGMASRRVRVDSLFLDEGFGTLDEEALETALETLAGLRQEGKLIGLISHVAALRERIATRIRVEPGSGGRSRLSGPGCAAR